MDKENVKLKIHKLLKLQYNAEKIGSTGEAYQAARIVRKLLVEYNLTLSDIDTNDEQPGVTVTQGVDMPGNDRYGNSWKYQLLGVIASNNLCMAYKRMSGKIFVVGAEDNVAIVQEFYKYLVKVFRRLAKKHWERSPYSADTTTESMFLRSYYAGVPVGLRENYESLKPTSEETALVVCHQEAIEDYVNDNFKWSDRKPKHRKRIVYGDVYDLGRRDGRKVNLNKQITND